MSLEKTALKASGLEDPLRLVSVMVEHTRQTHLRDALRDDTEIDDQRSEEIDNHLMTGLFTIINYLYSHPESEDEITYIRRVAEETSRLAGIRVNFNEFYTMTASALRRIAKTPTLRSEFDQYRMSLLTFESQ